MSKIILTTNDAGELVHTPEETNLLDKAVNGLLMPLNAFKSETAGQGTFYNEADAGVATLMHFCAGFAVGDMFGDQVPVLGQRRI